MNPENIMIKQDTNAARFLTALFGLLNKESEYAVLRNYEGLPEQNPSRDIDIAIEKKTYRCIQNKLVALVEQQGWKLLTLLNSDRLVTWVCAHLSSEGKSSLIQLDFFFHTSVFGIRLLSAREVIERRIFNGKIYHADKTYEFLDKYVYDRAVGAAYPEKYRATREAVASHPQVQAVVGRLFGCRSLEACDKESGRKLLIHALMGNLRKNPVGTLCRMLFFEYYRIRNYVCSTGFSIGFTGPDGSGKTTIIEQLTAQWGDVFRKAHVYYHFRPALFGNLGEVAHTAGIKKEVDRDYGNPHRGEKTGKVSSLLRLAYYSIDYILGYFVKVKSQIRITRIVIFDRYFTDIICDSRRSRIYLNHRFLYGFQRLFIPSLDYNILLTASVDTILARKRELDEAGIRTINEKIDYLATKRGYLKVTNERTPDDAVAEILRHVYDCQHRKNLKRLKGN